MNSLFSLRRLTLTQQWLVATLLAILPLLLAVIYAVSSLAEQTRQHRHLLLATSALKDLEASIAQQVSGLERANMQYLITRDEVFAGFYSERMQSLKSLREQMEQQLEEGSELAALDNLITHLETPPTRGNTLASAANTEQARTFWKSIDEIRLDFNEQIKTLTQEAIKQSRVNYEGYSRRLMVIVSLAIPGTVLLIILSTVAVARPWWRLVNTIRRLGEQEWHQPVRIDGPADFVELGDNLEWMRKQLLAIERQKQTFSQHVTHELKSPLAAIIEAESLLRDELPGTINESQRKILDILRANAANLSDFIQQFLNYNTVLHNLTPELISMDMKAVYEKARRHLASANPSKHILWHWQGEPNQVVSDPFCMQMILSNLMSNASKVVPDNGEIIVSVKNERSAWCLTVEDNGPGIPENEREKIFKPFYQGTQAKRAPLQGNGIGLSIVKECVQRLEGSIDIDTSSLGGARLSLRFPQTQTAEVSYVEAGYSTG